MKAAHSSVTPEENALCGWEVLLNCLRRQFILSGCGICLLENQRCGWELVISGSFWLPGCSGKHLAFAERNGESLCLNEKKLILLCIFLCSIRSLLPFCRIVLIVSSLMSWSAVATRRCVNRPPKRIQVVLGSGMGCRNPELQEKMHLAVSLPSCSGVGLLESTNSPVFPCTCLHTILFLSVCVVFFN